MFIFLLLISLASWSAELKPLPQSLIKMQIEYTFGVHKLKAGNFEGSVKWDEATKKILSGEFTLPITEIKGDKDTLVCHLREALGLDYERSDFPESHVCKDDKIPSEGKNAIAYPLIKAELLGPLDIGANQAKVRWTIHNKSKIETIPLEVIRSENKNFQIVGSWKMRRDDFDVVVKQVLFVKAANELTLNLDLMLQAK